MIATPLLAAALFAHMVQGQAVVANVPPSNTAPQLPYTLLTGTWTPAANAAAYPNMPAVGAWPDSDETKGHIASADMLNAKLVTDALAIVQKAVDPKLLAIPPSIRQDDFSAVAYQGDAGANCYWPATQCTAPAAADLALYPSVLFPDVASCPGNNVMGLTYDDGPSGPEQGPVSSLDLLSQLTTMNQKATFFNVGSSMAMNPAITQQMCQNHEVAVHTWTHAPLTSLDTQTIVAEIKYTEALIWYLCGVRPRYARAPYGDVDNRVRAIFGALGYEMVMWGTAYDTDDAADLQPGQTALSVTLAAWNKWAASANQPGFIGLEHSLSTNTTSAAIEALKLAQTLKASNAFPLTMEPVGQCQSKSSYVPLGSLVGSTAAAAGAPAASGASSTVAAVPSATVAPKPSGAAAASTQSAPTGTSAAAPPGQTIHNGAASLGVEKSAVAALVAGVVAYLAL